MRFWVVKLIKVSILGIAILIAVITVLQLGGVLTLVQSHVTIHNRNAVKTVRLSLDNLSEIHLGSVTVYHAPSMKNFANGIAEKIQKTLHFLHEKFGFKDLSLSVALFERSHNEIEKTSFRVPGRIWPIFIAENWENIQDSDDRVRRQLYMGLPHEAIEQRIAKMLYFIDARGRWIGDGLAELAAFNVALHQAPTVACEALRGRIQEVLEWIKRGHHRYNLLEDFPVHNNPDRPLSALERVGYDVAFAFWLELARHHGEEMIRNYWKAFRARFRLCPFEFCLLGPGAKEAARLLSEQTGEPIWPQIQEIKLSRVISVLQGARGTACRE